MKRQMREERVHACLVEAGSAVGLYEIVKASHLRTWQVTRALDALMAAGRVEDMWKEAPGTPPLARDRRLYFPVTAELERERDRHVCHRDGPTCSWDGCPRQYDDLACEGCFLSGGAA